MEASIWPTRWRHRRRISQYSHCSKIMDVAVKQLVAVRLFSRLEKNVYFKRILSYIGFQFKKYWNVSLHLSSLIRDVIKSPYCLHIYTLYSFGNPIFLFIFQVSLNKKKGIQLSERKQGRLRPLDSQCLFLHLYPMFWI